MAGHFPKEVGRKAAEQMGSVFAGGGWGDSIFQGTEAGVARGGLRRHPVAQEARRRHLASSLGKRGQVKGTGPAAQAHHWKPQPGI